MPRTQDTNPVLRARLRAWLRYLKVTWKVTNEELANRLKLTEPHVTNILNDRRTAGLDVFDKIVKYGHIRPDEVYGADPPGSPDVAAGGGNGSRR